MGLNIAVDVERAKWVELGEYDDRFRGVSVLLKSTESEAFLKRQAKLSEISPKKLRKGWSGTDAQLANVRASADCIQDWKGVEDDGAAVPFERETARRWAEDPGFLPFFTAVWRAANELAEEDREGEEESLGNSATP